MGKTATTLIVLTFYNACKNDEDMASYIDVLAPTLSFYTLIVNPHDSSSLKFYYKSLYLLEKHHTKFYAVN